MYLVSLPIPRNAGTQSENPKGCRFEYNKYQDVESKYKDARAGDDGRQEIDRQARRPKDERRVGSMRDVHEDAVKYRRRPRGSERQTERKER